MGSPSGGCRRRRTGSRGSSWRLSQGTPGHLGPAVEVVTGDAVVQADAAVRVNALVELGEHLAQRAAEVAQLVDLTRTVALQLLVLVVIVGLGGGGLREQVTET